MIPVSTRICCDCGNQTPIDSVRCLNPECNSPRVAILEKALASALDLVGDVLSHVTKPNFSDRRVSVAAEIAELRKLI